MFKRFVHFLVLVALISACQPPPATTTVAPPHTPKPEGPTSTSTPAPDEPAEWVFQENWWLEPQVWAHSPDSYTDPDGNLVMTLDYEAYAKAGLTVMGWYTADEKHIQELHDHGIIVVGTDSLTTTYRSVFQSWSEYESPPELMEAAIRDPFGNVFWDDFGVGDESHESWVVHSMLHPLWQEHMLGKLKAYVDAGVGGYTIDELAYGSLNMPDFNPNTLQLFNEYLFETYTDEELIALGVPWGVEDFTDFDYAALVRDHLPAGMTVLTLEDWYNGDITGNLPLIQEFQRFLRVEGQKVALRLVEQGRAYAQEKYGIHLPISANLNNLSDPEAWFWMDKLDFYSNEFPFNQYDYYPVGRSSAMLKQAHYFDTPMTILIQMSTRPEVRAWGKDKTVNLYRTMIADATAGGGAFHIETNVHEMVQDMDAIGPYYHFAMDYPLVFEGMEPMEGEIGLLHLWEADIYASYDDRAYVGLCDLLADSGYQFGAIFGAEEFKRGGELPIFPAPDYPLNPEDLSQYAVIFIPEMYQLTENHAEILIQYVEEGGTLVIFSIPNTTWDMDAIHPIIGPILAARGRGPTEIGNGKLIHIDGIWGKDFIDNPDPDVRTQLIQLLEAEGFQPEIRMANTRYLAATAYTGQDKMVVHFVNYDHEEGVDITTPTGLVDVEITLPDNLQLDSPGLYLFTPGEMPRELDGTLNGNMLQLTLPETYIWSVLLIGEEDILGEQVSALPTLTPTPVMSPTPIPTITPTSAPPTPTMDPDIVDTGYVIYDDSLAPGWRAESWESETQIDSTTMVYDGTQAIEVAAQKNGGIALVTDALPDISPYNWLVFYINIGETRNPLFVLDTYYEGVPISTELLYIADYTEGGKLEPGLWYQVVVPMSDLIPEGGTLVQINFAYDGSGTTFYLDEIRFVSAGP